MRKSRDAGFTLVELLVAVVILGIIVGVIAQVIIVGLRTTDDTSRRLSESHDAQMAASYFGGDVQSAADVSLNTPDACSATTSLVSFQWDDSGTAKVASYYLRTLGSERQLVRVYCAGSAPKVEVVVAHHLAAAASAASAACVPAAACAGSHPWKPDKVTIALTDDSGYAYDISASRRSTV